MKRAALLPAVLVLLSLAVWAKDIPMVGSPMAPAAAGVIELDHDHNGNTIVKVRVHHLARPSALAPAKTTYVIWFQPPDRQPEIQGELRVDKDLNGGFETRTAYRNFDVFITAEDAPRPQQPTGPVVLRATVEQ